MIKIAFIMNNLVYGGIENFYLNYIENYDFKSEFKIDIIYSNKRDDEIINRFKNKNINIIKCNYGVENNKFKYIKELTKILKENKYDIVHCNMMQNDMFPLYAAKRAHVKKRITHVHMNMDNKYVVYTKSKFKLLGRKIKIYLTDFLATDRFACSKIAGNSAFRHKYDIVYNAVDLDLFKFNKVIRNNLRSKYNVSDSNNLYGFIGRLSNEKNAEKAISVFKEIEKIDSNAKFLIIGKGPKKDLILKMIGNNKKYIIIDPVSNINDYYNMFDAIIFPSFSEGLGMVAIEAQVNGLPILASDRVPMETCISNNINFIALEKNNEIWAKNLFELLKTGHNDVIYNNNYNNYDIKKMANTLFDLYRK